MRYHLRLSGALHVPVNTYRGSQELEDAVLLDYEQTLSTLLSFVGRQVLVLFSGATESPFEIGRAHV